MPSDRTKISDEQAAAVHRFFRAAVDEKLSPAPTDDATGLAAGELETLCALAHDIYEAEAQRVGWSTQEASRVPWSRVPEPNKLAMRAAIRAVLAAFRTPPAPAEEKIAEWMLSVGLATGHGDTLEDLLHEATWQINELRARLAQPPAEKEKP